MRVPFGAYVARTDGGDTIDIIRLAIGDVETASVIVRPSPGIADGIVFVRAVRTAVPGAAGRESLDDFFDEIKRQ